MAAGLSRPGKSPEGPRKVPESPGKVPGHDGKGQDLGTKKSRDFPAPFFPCIPSKLLTELTLTDVHGNEATLRIGGFENLSIFESAILKKKKFQFYEKHG